MLEIPLDALETWAWYS